MRYVVKIEKEFINKQWLAKKIKSMQYTLDRHVINYNFVETDTSYKFYLRDIDKAYIYSGDYDPSIMIYENGLPYIIAIIGYGDTMPQVNIKEINEY